MSHEWTDRHPALVVGQALGVDQRLGVGARQVGPDHDTREHCDSRQRGSEGDERTATAGRPPGDPVAGGLLAADPVQEQEGQQRSSEDGSCPAAPATGAEHRGEHEQGSGRQGRLERHPEPEGGPVGDERYEPQSDGGRYDEPRQHWHRRADDAEGLPSVGKVGGGQVEGLARGYPGHGRAWVDGPSDGENAADDRRHSSSGQPQPPAADRNLHEVGEEGVGEEGPEPLAVDEEPTHAEHRGDGERCQRNLSGDQPAGLVHGRPTGMEDASADTCAGAGDVVGPCLHEWPGPRHGQNSRQLARGRLGRAGVPGRAVDAHDRDRTEARSEPLQRANIFVGNRANDGDERAGSRPSSQHLDDLAEARRAGGLDHGQVLHDRLPGVRCPARSPSRCHRS